MAFGLPIFTTPQQADYSKNEKQDYLKLQESQIIDVVFLSIGGVIFKLGESPIEKLSMQREAIFEKIETIKGKTLRQFIGNKPIILDINGTIHTKLVKDKNGLTAIDKLNENFVNGNEVDVVDGGGFNFGKWIILSINHNASDLCVSNNQMIPRKIEYQIKIERVLN